MSATSWLLGGGYDWHSAGDGTHTVASPEGGLALAALGHGPLGLDSPDGSLGRTLLPRGVAVDHGIVLLLSTDGSLVRRYDPVGPRLVPLAQVGADGASTAEPDWWLAPRRFRRAGNIAAYQGALCVADGEARRVQVFDLATLALIRIHGGIAVADVASGRRGVYLVDDRGRVYRAHPRHDGLVQVAEPAPALANPTRVAVDREERVYVGTGDGKLHLVAAPPGKEVHPETITDATQLRGRFDRPAVSVDRVGGLDLGPLADPCGLRTPERPRVRLESGALRWSIDPATTEVRARLEDGRLRHRFGPLDGEGADVAPGSAAAWEPTDLASVSGCVLVLDARYRILYAHEPASEVLRRRFGAPAESDAPWRMLAVDSEDCLLLWDGAAAVADRFDLAGRALGQVDAAAVRRHFLREPPVTPRAAPVRVTRDGIDPGDGPPVWPVPSRFPRGSWTSGWLDSDIYNCQWHTIELSLGRLPPGSKIVVRTRTADSAQTEAEVLASLAAGVEAVGSWRECAPLIAPTQPDEQASPVTATDLLVLSGPGQYLQLHVDLSGNGLDTPVIESLRLRFPRESLLDYLPAIYASPDEQREFLDRLLSLLQASWEPIERESATFERYLDPDAVPPAGMPFLANLLAVRLEGTWTAEENRRLLQAMPRLVGAWGTPRAMREWLRVYLSKLSGRPPEAIPPQIPALVESFVDRRRLLLGSEAARLGSAEGLWSPAVAGRFQLGVFDREGDVTLVSVGDPATDVFRQHAHAFRVYLPAAWVRTPEDEALVRRAIEMQRPAHTSYELVLVEPRFRIGEQSTIDLDTVISAPPEGRLGCARDEEAPSRPPRRRLGFDTVLDAGGPAAALGGADLILA